MSRSAGNQAHRSGVRRWRRVLAIALALAVIVVLVAAATDTVVASRTEHRLSRALLSSPRIVYDPEVTLGGFPFLSHARSGDFPGATITARGVPVSCPPPGHCHVELGATLGQFRMADGFSVTPGEFLHTTSLAVHTRIDSVNLGRMLGILDLTVNTPAPKDSAGGGGPGDGQLTRRRGVLLTGTVPLPPVDTHSAVAPSAAEYRGPKVKVSVSVDVTVDHGRLHLQGADFYRGPENHVDADVPGPLRAYVLSRFTTTLPILPMPWSVSAVDAHSEGSDLLLVGRTGPIAVRPQDF